MVYLHFTCETSVIINDFNIESVAIVPLKTNAPLDVDTDAVLTGTVAGKTFEAFGLGNTQLLETLSPIQHTELS